MVASASASERVEAVRAFNRLYTRKIGLLEKGMLGTEHSLTEVRVLYEIAHRAQPLASDLVRDLGLDPGYLSRILARFHQRGWLARIRSAEDARKSFLRLTRAGTKAFAALDAGACDGVERLLAPLSVEQQARLHSCLATARTLLEAPAQGSAPTLRVHRPGDMGWIIHKHGLLYAQEYGWNGQFEALVAEICAGFIRSFDPTGERCWIAEREGVPVGCVMLVRHSATIAKLRLLLVDPGERGKGLGVQLVDECIRFARAAGYRKMRLWTQSVLTSARRIYQSRDFRLVGSEHHDSFGASLIGETWELSLA